jgi:hypothetical protein
VAAICMDASGVCAEPAKCPLFLARADSRPTSEKCQERPFASIRICGHFVGPSQCSNKKAQAPGRTDRMPSHLCLAHYRPGLIGYQTGARIVRRAQDQTGPEYIRPCTVPSTLAVTPAASKSTTMSAGVNLIWGLG